MAHTTEQAMEQVDVIDGQSPADEGNSRREELKELMLQGLWKNNPSLVQVLGSARPWRSPPPLPMPWGWVLRPWWC